MAIFFSKMNHCSSAVALTKLQFVSIQSSFKGNSIELDLSDQTKHETKQNKKRYAYFCCDILYRQQLGLFLPTSAAGLGDF